MYAFSPLDFLASVDDGVVTYFNSFVNRSWIADDLIRALQENVLLKGGVVMTAYWWAWFRAPENDPKPGSRNPRDTLLYTLLMCVPAVLLARLMASFLPFRPRPLLNPELHLKVAFTLNTNWLESWSSFPSDHAVLFFTLATGFYLVSRRLGLLMYLYSAVFIALPRVYLGIHYPSDILAGALLGVAIASTVRIGVLRRVINRPAQRLLEYSPGLFYAGLFQLSYQTAVLYEPLRQVGRSALRNFHVLAGRF
jgi:undecaprenyl-diphosphatase